MIIQSYDERGYDDGAYIRLRLEMSDGTVREVELHEDAERAGGIDVKVFAEADR